MAINPIRLLDRLEPLLQEHEAAFRRANYTGEYGW
jgi:hypothetical protein